MRRAIGNDHLRRVLRAPSRRGSEQEEARGAGQRVVALGIGHFHADKSQFGEACPFCAMAVIRVQRPRTYHLVETVQDQEVGGEGAS